MQTRDCKVLIIDDDPTLRTALHTSLSASGFDVQEAADGGQGLLMLRQQPFELVLLDINMPGMTGFEVCQRIRANDTQIGVIIVTVRDAENDKVRALDMGADDFITKPFRLRELIARLRAVSRRRRGEDEPKLGTIHSGELEIALDTRQLRKNGEEIRLSPTEFDLLAFLMRNQGMPLTHINLLRSVWGPEYGGELEYLRSYVRLLRKKIEKDPAHPEYIITEPWIGYRFRNPSDPFAPNPAADEE